MLDLISEKLTELSSGGLTGIITMLLILLALFGIIKGAVRLVFLACTLGGAAYAAYWGSEQGLSKLREYWPEAPEISGNVMAIILGLIAFFILYKIFSFLTNPFEESNFISKFAFGIPGTIVSTAVAAGMVWFGINFMQDRGAEQEIKYLMAQNNPQKPSEYPPIAKLKQKFEATSIGQKFSKFYHLHDSRKYDLAKLIVIANTSLAKYNELGRDPRYAKILSHPKVRKLIAGSPDIQQDIRQDKVQSLLKNPELKSLLTDPTLQQDLDAISSDTLH